MAIAFVRAAGNNVASGTTLSTTIVAPAASSQLVVLVATDYTNAQMSISALTSQAWTKLADPPSTDGGATTPDLAVWVSTNPGTGTTVTVNSSGSGFPIEMVVLELSGTDNDTTTDGASTSTKTPATGTTVTPTAISPATPGCIGITNCATDSSIAISSIAAGAEGGTWTIPTNGAQPNGSGVERMTVAYQIFASKPASVQPVWTTASANTQFANLFCLRALPAGRGFATALPLIYLRKNV